MTNLMKIIDLYMVNEIVKYTNIYIYISDEKTTHNYSMNRHCKDTSRSEILTYFGLLYLKGIKKKETTRMFWNYGLTMG